MKHIRFCAVMMLLLFLFSACSSDVPDFFAFQEDRFSAEIKGSLRGQDFCAKISSDGGSANGEKSIRIEYLSPASLRGVTVCAVLDGDGEAEDCRVELGSLSFDLPDGSATGLLAPILALLLTEEARTVEKREDAYRLTLSDGQKLVVSAKGSPLEYASDTLFFRVVWWEQLDG